MKKTTKKAIMKAILYSLIFAFIFGIYLAYIAWQHNPQCEIHCEGYINISYLIMIFASWFFVSFVIIFPCIFIIIKVAQSFTQRTE